MPYLVTRADPARSADSIAALWAEVFGNFSRDRYDWLYGSNPAGAPLLCILYESESHEAVGSNALFPRRLSHRGRALLGGIAGDLMVQRKHRSLGPAVQLQRGMLAHCGESGMQLAYGFPNPKSAPIMQRVGFQRIGALTEWVLPLHSEYYLKKHIPQTWLRRPLATLLDLALRLRPKHFQPVFARPRACNVTDHFNDGFDKLWSRVASRYSLVGEKTAAFMDWRYRRCPSGTRQAFVVTSTDGEQLDGYVIFSIRDNRANIADFAHDPDRLGLDELLLRFIHAQRKEGMDAISAAMAASKDMTAAFEKRGFRSRGEINPLMAYVPPGAQLQLDDLLEGSWYLTPGDNDT